MNQQDHTIFLLCLSHVARTRNQDYIAEDAIENGEDDPPKTYLQQFVIVRFRLQLAAVGNGLFESGGFGNHDSDVRWERTSYVLTWEYGGGMCF